jgi:hypothetical protein
MRLPLKKHATMGFSLIDDRYRKIKISAVKLIFGIYNTSQSNNYKYMYCRNYPASEVRKVDNCTEFNSPEVDGEVLIGKDVSLKKGWFCEVEITGSGEFDLYGKVL